MAIPTARPASSRPINMGTSDFSPMAIKIEPMIAATGPHNITVLRP